MGVCGGAPCGCRSVLKRARRVAREAGQWIWGLKLRDAAINTRTYAPAGLPAHPSTEPTKKEHEPEAPRAHGQPCLNAPASPTPAPHHACTATVCAHATASAGWCPPPTCASTSRCRVCRTMWR